MIGWNGLRCVWLPRERRLFDGLTAHAHVLVQPGEEQGGAQVAGACGSMCVVEEPGYQKTNMGHGQRKVVSPSHPSRPYYIVSIHNGPV